MCKGFSGFESPCLLIGTVDTERVLRPVVGASGGDLSYVCPCEDLTNMMHCSGKGGWPLGRKPMHEDGMHGKKTVSYAT